MSREWQAAQEDTERARRDLAGARTHAEREVYEQKLSEAQEAVRALEGRNPLALPVAIRESELEAGG
jgi:hypothetical protein